MVRRPLPTSIQPAAAGPRFLVPDPPPLLDSVAVGANPASPAPRFLVPDAAPPSAPAATPLAQVTPASQMLHASYEPAPATPKAAPAPDEVVPVALSTAAPEPAPEPAPAADVVPVIQPHPAPQPELVAQKNLAVLTASGSGVTGLPELASDGYWIENAPLNEIFQYLARRSELQYFFNNEIAGPEYSVTGHLKLTDPNKQMEDLATAYGLTVYQQGGTIYLMTEAQLAKLPVEVMCYPLKYLRGAQPSPISAHSSSGSGEEGGSGGGSSGAGVADFTKLMAIIKPLLTRDQGQIQFEEKNNVLLVTDNGPRLKKVKEILEQIDRPKQQIVINVRILRVRKTHGSKIGVDWTNVLGTGMPIGARQSLNAMFGLPDSATLTKTLQTARNLGSSFSSSVDTILGGATPSTITTTNNTTTRNITNNSGTDGTSTYTDGMGLVFDALQMEAIVHALKNDDLVTQESCPTIITEDNEQGNVSFVDRFPIITSTVVATASGTNSSDEVRYKIDEEDPNAAKEPDKSREIGVTLSVTPTLLPDGTVRMRLRPRVANIVDLVTGPSGNVFPRVSESTVEGISRIPAGRSLFLGGFYDSSDNHKGNRVPILGGIPGLGKLFSYNDKSTEQLSLVFIITPRVYDASNPNELPAVNRNVEFNSGFNRVNPGYPVTPLLPPPTPENGELPLPVDRDDVAPPPPRATPPEARRSWFGRVFSRKAPSTKEASLVEPPPGRNRDAHPSL
jgi:type II secretory pathway component GspD/PulD (secretin)